MPDDNVINLAVRAGDNRLWTAEQALEDTLADLRAGRVEIDQMVIIMVSKAGKLRHSTVKVSFVERIALAQISLQMAIEEWRK